MRDLSQLSLSLTMQKAAPEQTIATLNSRMRTLAILQSQLRQLEQALREAESPAAGHAKDASAAPSAASR